MRVAFPVRVTTPRLVLTRVVEDDLADLLVMHQDPRVMATLGGFPVSVSTSFGGVVVSRER